MADSDHSTSASYHTTVLLAAFVISLVYLLFTVAKRPPFPEVRVRPFLERCHSAPIAHQGGTPENTLAAIRQASERQCRVVEVDLEFTNDGHPVLLHDDSVDRTSNGTGRIRDLTLEEVRRLDFGGWFGPQFSGEKIPTLQETVELCRELDLAIILDVKSNKLKTIAVLQQLFTKHSDLYDRMLVSSFNPDFIYMVRRADPNILVSVAMRSWEYTWDQSGCRKQHPEWWRYILAPLYDVVRTFFNEYIVWRLVQQPFVLIYKRDITLDVLTKWKGRGAHVIGWTMKSTAEAEQFTSQFDIPVLVDYMD